MPRCQKLQTVPRFVMEPCQYYLAFDKQIRNWNVSPSLANSKTLPVSRYLKLIKACENLQFLIGLRSIEASENKSNTRARKNVGTEKSGKSIPGWEKAQLGVEDICIGHVWGGWGRNYQRIRGTTCTDARKTFGPHFGSLAAGQFSRRNGRAKNKPGLVGSIAKVNLSPGIVTFLANRDKVRPHNAAPPLTLLYPIRRAMNAKNGIVRLGKSKSSLGRRLTHLCVRI